jgi:glutaredoxin
MMKLIRWSLGRVILTLDFLTRPTPIKRTAEDQERIDVRTGQLSFYQFQACPFCVKVRRYMVRHALNIELRDAKIPGIHKDDLIQHGKRHKVPCLRITSKEATDEWLYESSAIIDYLQKEFSLS